MIVKMSEPIDQGIRDINDQSRRNRLKKTRPYTASKDEETFDHYKLTSDLNAVTISHKLQCEKIKEISDRFLKQNSL